ncbi:sugar kinase [Candidatus Woesearchaeota archaeon]|nr:sugar kinase [Candidatus Woesearchaeota archaeon]
MVDLVIVGTVALDNVKTPFGEVKDAMGGSASYASLAASIFTDVGVVAVVGEDYPDEYLVKLKNKNIDTDGIEHTGKSFRWTGSYEFDMNDAKTHATELNNLETFDPVLPESYKDAKYVFLANIDPVLQLKVIEQIREPKLVAIDTMNFWIDSKKEDLLKVLEKVDVLLINDSEARQLFNTPNLVKAARQALKSGPDYIIIKKGEHGSILFTNEGEFIAPGYPLETVCDPTGAGDSFAGGLMGFIASADNVNNETIRKGIINGTMIASYDVEGFSVEKLENLTSDDIKKRMSSLRRMCEY